MSLWIKSQNGDHLVEAANIQVTKSVIFAGTYDHFPKVGEYESHERAREVVNEIIEFINILNCARPNVSFNTVVFKMPQK